MSRSFFIALALSVFISACTEKNQPEQPSVTLPSETPASEMTVVSEVQFQGQATQVLQMEISGGSLYLTGRPFGFSRWIISSDPESPYLAYAMSDNITAFSNQEYFGPWVLDWYASGALSLSGNYAMTAGSAGISIIDISQSTFATEVNRSPRNKDNTVLDAGLAFSAIVQPPNLPYVYGFRVQDPIVRLKKSLPNLQMVDTFSPQGNLCCTRSATYFGSKIYAAMDSRLGIFDLNSSGGISNFTEFDGLQAFRVTKTPDRLYVHHEPKASASSLPFPAGIYVFDNTGVVVQYFPLRPITFAVSDDNRYLYSNEDDQNIRIYRIN